MPAPLIRRYRQLLGVGGMIAAPLLLFLANSKQPAERNAVDRMVVYVSAPVQAVVIAALDGLASVWNGYVALVDAEANNRDLRAENERLRQDLFATREHALENQRLQLLLEMRGRAPELTPILARVIAVSPSPLFRSVRLNVGLGAGVAQGSTVLHAEGLVGRVVAVGQSWCDVMLLADPNLSTEVLVQRTRARARVRGAGRDHVLGIQVEQLARTDDIEPGDVLLTSGVGGVFPKGLQVGTVTAIERGAFGLYQQATVVPSVDFGRLEEALVLRPGFSRQATYEDQPAAAPTGPEG